MWAVSDSQTVPSQQIGLQVCCDTSFWALDSFGCVSISILSFKSCLIMLTFTARASDSEFA